MDTTAATNRSTRNRILVGFGFVALAVLALALTFGTGTTHKATGYGSTCIGTVCTTTGDVPKALPVNDRGFSSTCVGTVCTTSGRFVEPAQPTTKEVTPDPVSARVLQARGVSGETCIGNDPCTVSR